MMVSIGLFPAVVDQTSPRNMFTARTNIDVVAYRMDRDDPFGFAILRTQHHACFNGVTGFADIYRLFVNKHLALCDTRPAKQTFH